MPCFSPSANSHPSPLQHIGWFTSFSTLRLVVNLERSAWSSEETMESDNGGIEDANEKPERIDEASGAGEENGVTGK